MAGDELSYRAPRPGEEAAILELIDASFGDRWPGIPISVSRLEHLKWKMSSPDGVVYISDRESGIYALQVKLP